MKQCWKVYFSDSILFLLVGKVGLIYNGIAKRLVLVPDTRNQLPAQKSQPDYRGKFNRTEWTVHLSINRLLGKHSAMWVINQFSSITIFSLRRRFLGIETVCLSVETSITVVPFFTDYENCVISIRTGSKVNSPSLIHFTNINNEHFLIYCYHLLWDYI